jgi:ribosomal-protein-alanine N-acetyltransferase
VIVAETPRLRLRRLRLDDEEAVFAIASDPEQMRYYPRPKTRDEVRAWLDWNLSLYERHGFGTWAVETAPDWRFAGYCGIRPVTVDGAGEFELAWHIAKTHWNRGLGTEAAQLAAERAFKRFGLTRLVALIHPDNIPSRRVANKLGMTEERELVHDGEPTVLASIVSPGRCTG